MSDAISSKITEELEKIPGIAERIERSTSIEDTAEVAIELYSTLGFCHGFLGKELMDFPNRETPEFPWNQSTLTNCWNSYQAEFHKGIKFREEME